MLLNAFTSDLFVILGPALCVGLMVALTHAPLGQEVLKRGILFMDLAIAQLAALGVILLHDAAPWLMQAGALACALLGALFFRWVEKRAPDLQEAIIGSTFVGALCLGLLVLHHTPHGGEMSHTLLTGNMLFVTWLDIATHAPVYLFVLCLWLSWKRAHKGLVFYTLFALAITSSVQLVGVYVVFASLVLPAIAARGFQNDSLYAAWGCGALSLISGVLVSTLWDIPTGPLVVIAYLAIGTIFYSVGRLRSTNAKELI